MKRALGAAVILFAAACSPGNTTDNAGLNVVGPTPTVRTTQPLPTQSLPTQVPIAILGPSPVPLSTPTSVVIPLQPTPTVVPATVTPAVVAEAAEPTVASNGDAPRPTAVPASTSVPASTDSEEVRATNGAEVYTLNCARCHAENGAGSDRYRGLIGVGNTYSTAGMIAELTSGHPVTFGFADRLSADEIASVVAYVKARFP